MPAGRQQRDGGDRARQEQHQRSRMRQTRQIDRAHELEHLGFQSAFVSSLAPVAAHEQEPPPIAGTGWIGALVAEENAA
jgi:hypothetical protein